MFDATKFAVAKGGKFFGYADARQIARSNGKLELFDAGAAQIAEAETAVATARAKEATETVKPSEGAKPEQIRRGPAKA